MIRILLADDHAIRQDGLRDIQVSQPDMTVVAEAYNGRAALAVVAAEAPDLVIMDIGMPEMNGIEATRLIRQLHPGTRVVMLSVYSTTEHVCQALAAGAGGYVLKEAAGQELVAAVRAVHGNRRFLSRKIDPVLVDRYCDTRSLAKSPLTRLSERERLVMQLVVEGHTSAAIATRLGLSPKTVETYRSRLMQKLDIHDIPGLVKFAIQHGLTTI